jgi:hypothetical protein
LLALTDTAGDTAGFLREAGYGKVVPLDDAARIADGLRDFLAGIRAGEVMPPRPEVVAAHSRRVLSLGLADLLDGLTERS